MTMDKIAMLSSFARHAKRLGADKSGATAIEYALIASFVGAVIAGAVMALGVKVTGLYQSVSNLFG
jgi:Flp pilus assembly pilin Flp